MEPFPHVTIYVLVSSMWAHTASGMFRNDPKRWPPPPCKMYIPLHPLDDPMCPEIEAPVCAKNGVTYKNECFFCVANWEFYYTIKFEKFGECESQD